MITIGELAIKEEKDEVIISARIKGEGIDEDLWYKVPQKFGKYLLPNNSDAFLVGLLFLGLRTGNDIKTTSPVSARLYYNINHYVIPALCLADPELKPVKVIAETYEEDLNVGKIAATGFSCGVDSFAAYTDHLEEKGSYEIGYFTFFNAGSHGSGGEKTKEIFRKRLERVKKFAESVNKEVITVDSNISEILQMKFQQTNTLRNISCALLFQKLFKNYYSASKNRFDYLKLDKYDSQDYDSIMLSLLSTESITFHSAVANLTRLERTQLITRNEKSYGHLDVCTSENRRKGNKNCSDCNKCRRTALTLDLLGKLPLYEKVFDIETYKSKKHSYIAHVIANRKKDQINKDLYELLKEKKAINYNEIVQSKIQSLLNIF